MSPQILVLRLSKIFPLHTFFCAETHRYNHCMPFGERHTVDYTLHVLPGIDGNDCCMYSGNTAAECGGKFANHVAAMFEHEHNITSNTPSDPIDFVTDDRGAKVEETSQL